MNLVKLFEIQQVLDERIIKEHSLQGVDLVDKKIIALKVELSEFANETRAFKFWSKKEPSPKEVTLEEYVDALHFFLSLGLSRGWNKFITEIDAPPFKGLRIVDHIYSLLQNQYLSSGHYEEAFEHFFAVGQKLGFTENEIFNAYLEKNATNHDRQDNSY